jgi:hypothetical protein
MDYRGLWQRTRKEGRKEGGREGEGGEEREDEGARG